MQQQLVTDGFADGLHICKAISDQLLLYIVNHKLLRMLLSRQIA